MNEQDIHTGRLTLARMMSAHSGQGTYFTQHRNITVTITQELETNGSVLKKNSATYADG